MLKVAEKFENVFVRLGQSEPRYMSYFLEVDSKGNKKKIGPPNLDDWENARTLLKFLKIFYIVPLKFSGSLYVTSNSFFNELIYMCCYPIFDPCFDKFSEKSKNSEKH